MDAKPKIAWISVLSLVAAGGALAASPAHEGDPKMRDRKPAFVGRSVRTTVAPGMSMAGSGPSLGFAANGVRLLSWLTLGDFGVPSNGNANVVWHYISPSGTPYALVGLSTGVGVVRLTDPSDPEIVTVVPGPTSLWRDVRVYGQYAYAGSEASGAAIQAIDLTQIDSNVVTLANTFATSGETRTHTVWIDEASGFLYRAGGGSNGLRIYDLNANPTNPPQVATWSNFYVHEVLARTYTSGPWAGKQIAFCCSGSNGGFASTGLRVLDVTNKANIVQLDDVFWPNPGYSHQIDLSSDLQYAFINDELDEGSTVATTRTIVVDVSDLANLSIAGFFTNGNSAIGHNNYTVGNKLYCANYRSGLRVFDVTNPVAAVEIASYDTWETDDNPEYNGLWMANPFLPSGIILGSDIEKGLFVWWEGAPSVDVALVQAPPALIPPAGTTLDATVTESAPGMLVAGTVQLNYDAGAGVVVVPLTDLGLGNYQLDFPALPCGSNVSWYLSAESTNGITWTTPEGGASAPYVSTVGFGSVVMLQNDMELPAGWAAGDTGDNATSGLWTRGNPLGTAAQPEDDHTPVGTSCWFTGQGTSPGNIGEQDVDNGTTTLKTAVHDLSGMSAPILGYWRWYVNDGNNAVDDSFRVEVSNGGAWATVELIGPGHPEASGGWFYHEFRVADFVTPNATVQVRFKASDLGQGSIVEAAIDDFVVRDIDCGGIVAYCTAGTSGNGCVASLGGNGAPSATATSGFTLDVSGAEGQKQGLIFYGISGATANSWGPGSSSFLCVKSPTQRTPVQGSGGTSGGCDGAFSIDWNAFVSSHPGSLGTPFSAGATVWSQCWYRDPPSVNTTSLSNGVRFDVGP
jgi:choice-of-anchor B domain-containing protein